MRRYKFIKESLFNPSFEEAFEFVFREYIKLYDKFISSGGIGKKPDLLPVMKKVTKKFNSFNKESSNFSTEDLIKEYINYRLPEIKKAKVPDSVIEYYGINTLPKQYIKNI